MTGDNLALAALVTTVLSFVVPAVVAFLRDVNAPPKWIGILYAVICFVFAALALWIQGVVFIHNGQTAREWVIYYLTDFAAIYGQAKVFYTQFYKLIAPDLTARLEGQPKE